MRALLAALALGLSACAPVGDLPAVNPAEAEIALLRFRVDALERAMPEAWIVMGVSAGGERGLEIAYTLPGGGIGYWRHVSTPGTNAGTTGIVSCFLSARVGSPLPDCARRAFPD